MIENTDLKLKKPVFYMKS